MNEIQRYPLALTDKRTITRRMFDRSRGMAGVFVEPAVTSNYGALHAYMRESDSILLAGFVLLADRLARYDLVAIPLSDHDMHFRSVQIQTMSSRQLPGRVESFIALMTKHLYELLIRIRALTATRGTKA